MIELCSSPSVYRGGLLQALAGLMRRTRAQDRVSSCQPGAVRQRALLLEPARGHAPVATAPAGAPDIARRNLHLSGQINRTLILILYIRMRNINTHSMRLCRIRLEKHTDSGRVPPQGVTMTKGLSPEERGGAGE